MAKTDIIVIGASAGGVEVLTKLAANLPADLPASVFVVLHTSPEGRSLLPDILSHAGPLPATHPRDGDAIRRGHIYVACPDYHLLIKGDTIGVVRGPRENRHRPAIDPLFRSAALQYGPRVVGVVLSGAMDDGTAGLLEIKRRGGLAVVQDPDTAPQPGMPGSALRHVNVDYIAAPDELGRVLTNLVLKDMNPETDRDPSQRLGEEVKIAEADMGAIENEQRPGRPSGFTCPECHGALWEIENGELLRFRCRVGHALTADALAMDQSEAVERALWVALRAMEESASLHRRMAERARQRELFRTAETHEQNAAEQEESAHFIQEKLLKRSA